MKKCDEEEPPPIPQKQQNLGQKLKKIVGKKGGQVTPVLPFPVHISNSGGAQDSNGGGGVQDSSKELENNNHPLKVSARKLGATVWEIYNYNLPVAKMHHGGGSRRNHHHHHHHHRHHLLEDKPDPYPELVSC